MLVAKRRDIDPAPTCTLTRLGREQVRRKSGGHCHVCDGQISGNDRQLNLALPLSMGGEGSVLNALRTGLQHVPPELGVWSDQTQMQRMMARSDIQRSGNGYNSE